MKKIFILISVLSVILLSACGSIKKTNTIDDVQEKKLWEGRKMQVKWGKVIDTWVDVEKTETSTGFTPNN